MFDPCPPHLYIIYSEDQPIYEQIRKNPHFKRIEFIRGSKEVLQNYDFDKLNNCIFIIDDLMNELVNDKQVRNIFTRLSHHKKITILSLLQNMYPRGAHSKDIRLNLHYVIIMKSFTLEEQLTTFGYQAFTKILNFFQALMI